MKQKEVDNTNSLRDNNVDTKIKLAALWTTLMFLYIYADWFELMTPGAIESTMNLETPIGIVTPNLLVIFSVVLIIPTLMIFLSIFVKARINKWLNIILGILYSIISILIIISDIGDKWRTFFVVYNVVELIILSVIVWQAWNWPKEQLT